MSYSKIPNAKRVDGVSLYRPYSWDSSELGGSNPIVRCTNPQKCYLPKEGRISFQYVDNAEVIELPCRSCVYCRRQHARNWALRCTHEAMYHDHNCFITLTYAPEHLPISKTGHQTLEKDALQKFFKRLRKELDKSGIKIRYFACGEYGDKLGRPHYHAIIFGYDFPDKLPLRGRRNAFPLYVSELLERVWPYGHSCVCNFTYETAAYVAGYCVKKVNGKRAVKHYDGREPEFSVMSRGRSGLNLETGQYYAGGGLGYEFFYENLKDMYETDCIVLRGGVRLGVPKYYDKLLEREDPQLYAKVKQARKDRHVDEKNAIVTPEDRERLERTEKARISLLKNQIRKFENDV